MNYKALILFLVGIVLWSCNRQSPEEKIKYLSGYWEIKKVQINPDSTLTYSMNPQIDFFTIEGDSGIRKKVQPQIDGTYKTSKASENIFLSIQGDSLWIRYKTPYDSWRETVLEASSQHMVIQSEDGKIYYYEKYTPLNIKENEEE